MRLQFVFLLSGVFLLSCGTSEEPSEVRSLDREWVAEWRTLPESFPGVENVDFTMNGKISFSSDSVTIMAYGYEGCIFSEDTLSHTLRWVMKGDSLQLINEDDIQGMTYIVKSMTDEKIDMVMMEDIFLTLSK